MTFASLYQHHPCNSIFSHNYIDFTTYHANVCEYDVDGSCRLVASQSRFDGTILVSRRDVPSLWPTELDYPGRERLPEMLLLIGTDRFPVRIDFALKSRLFPGFCQALPRVNPSLNCCSIKIVIDCGVQEVIKSDDICLKLLMYLYFYVFYCIGIVFVHYLFSKSF